MPLRAWFNHVLEAPSLPEAREAVRGLLEELAGGPPSPERRTEIVETARAEVASLLGGRPEEVLLTSGGTEAANLALKGTAGAYRGETRRLVLSAVEHFMVLHPARSLSRDGFDLRLIPTAGDGRVEPAEVEEALRDGAALLSVQAANHEVGALQPLDDIAALARRHGVPLHVDAVAAAGLVRLDVSALGADLLSVSASRLGGLPGAGALWVREGLRLRPLLEGGTQEGGMRAGGENLAGLAAFAAAARAISGCEEDRASRTRRLRDRLEEGLRARVDGMQVHGPPADARLPGHLHVRFPGVEGEALLLRLHREGIEASSGSACASEVGKPSHVLAAMGLDRAAARSSILFSLGPSSREDDVERALAAVPDAVRRLQEIAGRLA